MASGIKYPKELKERAVRLFLEAQASAEPGTSDTSIYNRLSAQLGINHTTLRNWVKQAQIDSGQREGVTTAEAKEIKELKREVKELKQVLLALLNDKAAREKLTAAAIAGDSKAAKIIDYLKEYIYRSIEGE